MTTFRSVLRSRGFQILGASAVSAAAAGAAGYRVAQGRLRSHYEEIAEKEIAEAKSYYSRLYKTEEELSSPSEVLERLHGEGASQEAVEAHARYLGERGLTTEVPAKTEEELGKPVEEVVVEEEVIVISEDDFDYETELRHRTSDRPYVISHDEFFQNEPDHEQAQLTYYEGDGVLSDEQGVPVPDEDSTVGDDNLTRFGYGSKDEHIVYVRNEDLRVDFEIQRSFGKYAKEVLGFEDEDLETRGALKHSDRRGVRKFRNHDE
jgi:hypothetical protein